ncbi:MAG: CoB--CoM heterodisulfide reductase iron-sulfur subunit A family protein [Candidatus Nezhaarchaeales archaeon]
MPPSVLVIGGGIAGIEASLNLADYGLEVYLVEESPSIGGLMARLDKTFPTLDCSICIEAPKMYEVRRHPNIKLLTYTEVRRVDRVGDKFRVRLVKKARYVDEEKCKGCGKCAEACPVKVPDEMDAKVGGLRKLIYVPFPQAVPNVYVIDPRCRLGKMRDRGACVGGCIVDCSQCRECPIALCVKACEREGAKAVMLWQRDKVIDVTVGSIVVATGLEPMEPPRGTLGYGIYPNVLTHMQYERLMNAGGPTMGEILRPSDGRRPSRVVWVQCVGSRVDPKSQPGVPYCSKVCCMVSAKQTIITKEHDPSIDTYVLYSDLRTYAKGFHELYRKAVGMGVKYVKAGPAEVREDPSTGMLRITYEDVERGAVEELSADILVLCTALLPSRSNAKLAKVLKVELDELGFFKERDPVGSPLEAADGIYLCGGATGPVDISESVAQAIAASMRAALRAVRAG